MSSAGRGWSIRPRCDAANGFENVRNGRRNTLAHAEASVYTLRASFCMDNAIDLLTHGAEWNPTLDIVPGAHRMPVTVEPGTPATQACTLMLMHNYSQLPVIEDLRKVVGVFTWRCVLLASLRGQPLGTVEDLLEPDPPPIFKRSEPLLKAIRAVIEHKYVLVSDDDDAIVGLVTSSDLSAELLHLRDICSDCRNRKLAWRPLETRTDRARRNQQIDQRKGPVRGSAHIG
jgi:CBS domain-containing protein